MVHVLRKDERYGVGEIAARHIGSGASRRDGDFLPAESSVARIPHDRRDVVRTFREHDDFWSALEDTRVAAILLAHVCVVGYVALYDARESLAERTHVCKVYRVR